MHTKKILRLSVQVDMKDTMETTAQTLKALGDATRLRILALLKLGELCVCDIMTSLPQSTASRHLAYLRNAGWVRATRRGKWMYYRLATESSFNGPGQADRILHHLSSLAQSRDDQKTLEEYLLTKATDTCTKSA